MLDFLAFGNAYMEVIRNRVGQPCQLRTALAKYTRRGIAESQYYFVPSWNQEQACTPGSVLHLREPDINQEIYGLPNWFAAMHSGLLNASATLFRGKYYFNGSHAGFILYINDAMHDEQSVAAIEAQMLSTKGVGNFRNLCIYSPNGKEKGVQLIPLGEAATRDAFLSIKNVTRDDQLTALRIPPQLIGIVPHNTAGFGSIRDAAMIYLPT